MAGRREMGKEGKGGTIGQDWRPGSRGLKTKLTELYKDKVGGVGGGAMEAHPLGRGQKCWEESQVLNDTGRIVALKC